MSAKNIKITNKFWQYNLLLTIITRLAIAKGTIRVQFIENFYKYPAFLLVKTHLLKSNYAIICRE